MCVCSDTLCMCGNNIQGEIAPDSECDNEPCCNVNCPGNSAQKCGNYGTYWTSYTCE